MSLSGDQDVTIDDLSDSAAGSDGGSLIDASPPSAPGSPVLGAARQTGRLHNSQPAPAVATTPEPEPGPSPSPGPGPGTGTGSQHTPAPGPSSSASPAEPQTSAGPGSSVAPPGGSAAGASPPAAADGANAGERFAVDGADAGEPFAADGADTGERMDTAPGGASGGADEGPTVDSDVEVIPVDSDVEVIPVDDADPPPRPRAVARPEARRSLGVWRETDFQEPGRGLAVDRGRDAGPETAGQNPLPAAARPPADDVITAAVSADEHKTPAKAEGGGFLTGPDVRSPASEDGQCCTICFESWSNSGEHRIASLRCGHLFGKSCIERWLRGREQRCPQCNAKANRRDVRVIFAKSLRVLDTTDRDRAMEELDRERETRRRLELDFAVVQVKCQMKENHIAKLQSELRALQNRVGGDGGSGGTDGGGGSPQPAGAAAAAKLSLQCSVEVSRPGGCRVLEHNSWLGMLVASQPSQNTLFPGHGVRKINTLDMRAMQFVSLHQKQIRDVRFSPEQRDLLLSVSLDRRAKITNICGNTLVQTYECEAPVWSCAWDRDAPHTFYAGLQSGAVLSFDTRAGTEPLLRLEGGSPVVALRHVPRGGPDASGGLLACRLADCSLQEVAGQRRCHPLPLNGPFVSADFDERTRHLLVSSRPSSRQPHAQHTVCRLQRAPGRPGETETAPVTAEVVQVFRGGTSQRVLSRSALVPNPLQPDVPLVCASQETAQLTQLWDLASGECAVTLAASEPVLDACPLTAQDRHFLALLTEKAVKMYRWEVT